jgi:membrane protein DedA with SNARE-associated domain
MEHYIDQLLALVSHTSSFVLYAFLAVGAVIENVFPPVPGDTITVFGAFMVGTSRLAYAATYILTTIGSVIGFMLLFFAGRGLGHDRFLNGNGKYFSKEQVEKTNRWFGKYGYFVVVANRFVPGLRSVVSISAGITDMGWKRVTLCALVSASIWNLLVIQIGFMLGSNWQSVKSEFRILIGRYNTVMLIVLSLLILFLIFKKIKKAYLGRT